MHIAMPTYDTVLVFGDHNDRVIETVGITHDGRIFELGYYNGLQHKKAIINISPATGCPVGCNFCELVEAGRLLKPDEMVHQVKMMSGITRLYDDYFPKQTEAITPDSTSKKLKINIAKTGEPALNPFLEDGIWGIISAFPDASFKLSSVMPRTKTLVERFRSYGRLAQSYNGGSIQPQISLISTNDSYRQKSAKMPLAGLRQIRSAVDAWHEQNPDGRTPNCSLLVSDDTPCNPAEVRDILPPGTVRFRLRKVVQTRHAEQSGLKSAADQRFKTILAEFREAGYLDVSDAGIPSPTEAEFSLAANVTRDHIKKGEFEPGVWHLTHDNGTLISKQLGSPDKIEHLWTQDTAPVI